MIFLYITSSLIFTSHTAGRSGGGAIAQKNDKAFRCVTLSPLWDNIFARCPCYVESIVKRVRTRPSELERLGTAWVSTANRLAPACPCLGTKEKIDPSSQGLHRIQLHTCLKCHCWQIRSLYRAQTLVISSPDAGSHGQMMLDIHIYIYIDTYIYIYIFMYIYVCVRIYVCLVE